MTSRPDLQAIERVYRTRAADFFRYALARTGDAERAHDAVQEGFARALRARSTFRGSGSLEAWVARCVINAAHDATRDAAPSSEVVRERAASPADDPLIEQVRRAVRQLPERQREAVFLRHFLDFDYSTIAETLGIEVGTVSATLHAARASLSKTLQLEVSS